jgi:hypothetical protein
VFSENGLELIDETLRGLHDLFVGWEGHFGGLELLAEVCDSRGQ